MAETKPPSLKDRLVTAHQCTGRDDHTLAGEAWHRIDQLERELASAREALRELVRLDGIWRNNADVSSDDWDAAWQAARAALKGSQ